MSEEKKESRSRVARAIEAGQLAAGSNAALTSTLLLHGLPLLVHVLPHTPQLLARFLVMLSKRDKDDAA